MIKQSITYTDFNGDERTDDFYFNLSDHELAELAIIEETDLRGSLRRIGESGNPRLILDTFRELLLSAYGERSSDGRRFMKSKELSAEFASTGAFDVIYMKLVTDAEFSAAFTNGLVARVGGNVQQASQFNRPAPRDHQEKVVKTVELPQNPIPTFQRPPEEDMTGRPAHEQNVGIIKEWPEPTV